MATDPPQGKRFSHVYLERGEPRADSARARRRVSSVLWGLNDYERSGLGPFVARELGVELPGSYAVDWTRFITSCELRDFLDFITLTTKCLLGNGLAKTASAWIAEVSRIFQEENLRYRIDARGGVHFFIDEEFERSRTATVSALQPPRYSNVLNAFEQTYIELEATPPNGKGAIRATFSAAEGSFA